jgi:hypothetical protein
MTGSGGLLTVRSSGIDTLNLAARGVVRDEVWGMLGDAKLSAQEGDEAELIRFPVSGQVFLLKPYGMRGYTYFVGRGQGRRDLSHSDRCGAATA